MITPREFRSKLLTTRWFSDTIKPTGYCFFQGARMPKSRNFVRRSIDLTAKQWRRLEALAIEHNSLAVTGSRAKQPSWRALLKEITDGTLTIIRKDSDREQD
jgi:hypothetical protein